MIIYVETSKESSELWGANDQLSPDFLRKEQMIIDCIIRLFILLSIHRRISGSDDYLLITLI